MSSWYSSFHRWQLDHYRVRVCVACLVLAVVWEVSAAGCTLYLVPSQQVFMLPDHQNVLQNLAMKCYLSDCDDPAQSAEVKWTIVPPLPHEDVEEEGCFIPGSCIRFTSLGENHASEDPYHVTCSSKLDPSQNETLSFKINRKPYFVNNTNGSLTFRVGERGTIDFGVMPGVPDVGDRYHYSKNEEKVSGTNGKIVIEPVTRDNGSIYILRFPDSHETRYISVTVFEEHQVVAAVRTAVEIAPFLDGDRTCLHWEAGDNVTIDNPELYSTSGTVLRINRVSSKDVGRVFTCVAEGNVKLKTRLLSKEHLSLCVEGEENHLVIDRVINATVCDGGRSCLSLSWSLEHKHIAHRVTHVYGVVNSSIEFVSKLNYILGEDRIYGTRGLVLSGGNCSSNSSTDPFVSSNPDDDDAQKIYVAFGVSLVLSVLLGVLLGFGLCYLYRRRHRRLGRVCPDPENGNGGIPPLHGPQLPPPPNPDNEDQPADQNPGLQNGDNPPPQNSDPPGPLNNGNQPPPQNSGPPELPRQPPATVPTSPKPTPAASEGVSSPTTPPVPTLPSTSSHPHQHPLTSKTTKSNS